MVGGEFSCFGKRDDFGSEDLGKLLLIFVD